MSAAQVSAYLTTRPEDQSAALENLRTLLRSLLPKAEEAMSYAMPGLRIGGRMVAGYAGCAKTCGYYPHSSSIVPLFSPELAARGFRHSTGAIRFTPANPLPDDLLRRPVAARLAEIGRG